MNNPNLETILVVDDHPVNLKILLTLLMNKNYKVLVAEDGSRALAQVKRTQVDLILLDIMMPGIDGFETCRQLKEDDSTSGIPIIFITALSGTDDKVKALRLGGADYITKPFQTEEVLARVRTQLTIKRQARELERKTKIKEEVKRLKSLQTMAGAIAHQLNNQLFVVSGSLELIENLKNNEKKILSDAKKALKKATEIGSGMLSYLSQDYSEKGPVNIADCIVNTFQHVKEHQTDISLHFAKPEKPIYIHGNAKKIVIVFAALLQNAVEAIEGLPGNIEVSFSVQPIEENVIPIMFRGDLAHSDSFVLCHIVDQGQGISKEHLELIFEPFFSTRFLGRGLGLAAAAGIMRNHHGVILVESEPGKGSSFTMGFPCLEDSST